MATFAGAWTAGPIAQQPVAHLPWGHVTVLLDKLSAQEDRDKYAAAAVENGWSRNVLTNMIASSALERTGAAPSNFAQQPVAQDSELAWQIAKNPMILDFLDLSGEVAERELEESLTDRIVDTLRELGPGFAFVGRQVHFDVGGEGFYADLLFFHVEQLRYVVIELKTGKFKPEHAGRCVDWSRSGSRPGIRTPTPSRVHLRSLSVRSRTCNIGGVGVVFTRFGLSP